MSTQAIPFLITILPEKQELLELNFNVCINPDGTALVTDNKNKSTKIEALFSGSVDRLQIGAILNSLQHINSSLNDTTRPYAEISVHTSSIYCTNVLNEWIYKWTPDFSTKPNGDLLDQLYPLLLSLQNLEILWSL